MFIYSLIHKSTWQKRLKNRIIDVFDFKNITIATEIERTQKPCLQEATAYAI